jgi:hypothetical protein
VGEHLAHIDSVIEPDAHRGSARPHDMPFETLPRAQLDRDGIADVPRKAALGHDSASRDVPDPAQFLPVSRNQLADAKDREKSPAFPPLDWTRDVGRGRDGI